MVVKTGVHYHIKVGPEVVRLYDEPPMRGPYYDIIVDDLDVAHDMAIGIIEELLPEYLDEDDVDESYEYSDAVTLAVKMDETLGDAWSVNQLGHDIEFEICAGCQPAGMN